jgi:hypothetical protein
MARSTSNRVSPQRRDDTSKSLLDTSSDDICAVRQIVAGTCPISLRFLLAADILPAPRLLVAVLKLLLLGELDIRVPACGAEAATGPPP